MKDYDEYQSKLPWHPRNKKAQQAYHDDNARLRDEFFADARKELGYGDLLTDEGCQHLESQAWSDGHSGGYGDIFCALCDLCGLVEMLAKPGVWRKGEKA